MMAEDVHVWLIIAAFPLLFSIPLVGTQSRLYYPNDGIVLLDNKNFYDVVPGTENAWFIQFYSSWCGHCIRFSTTWNKLGKDIADWKNVMKLAVVDCSHQENVELCRKHSVEEYPTLKFFTAFPNENSMGVKYTTSREIPDLKASIISFLENLKQDQFRPPALPHFEPLSSLEDIWADVTTSIHHTVILFEDAISKRQMQGKELMLDYSARTDLVFRRMEKEQVSKFGVREFPSLFLIEKDGIFKKIAAHQDREGFKAELNKVLGVTGGGNSSIPQLADEALLYKPKVIKRSDIVFLSDLESGLHYSLWQEVGGHETISGQRLNALKAYVGVLAKYFPGDEKNVRFLKSIDLALQRQTLPLTGSAWLRLLKIKQREDASVKMTTEWIGCKGSSSFYRGYPCSLWSIFHTLTVNAVLDAGQMEDYDPLEVLRTMRDYIKHFFGCRECAAHFMKMAVNIEAEVKEPTDAILWLWRTHNKANLRLHGDITEDPAHLKVQFPTKHQCPNCYMLYKNNVIFYEIGVLFFLTKMYSHSEIIRDGNHSLADGFVLKNKARHKDFEKLVQLREKRNLIKERSIKNLFKRKHENVKRRVDDLREKEIESRTNTALDSQYYMGWGLNTIDISMCVMFYIICSAILVMLYYHLSQNHKFKLHCLWRKSH